MQIELIGCTGAGKSTLTAKLQQVAKTVAMDLVLANDVILPDWNATSTSKTLRALQLHWIAGCEVLSQRHRYQDYLAVSRHALAVAGIPRMQQWNQMRKVLKQLGRYERLRRLRSNSLPVMVDEGTLHSAHNLFVHVGRSAPREQLQQFADCVPLPDLVVLLRSPATTLIDRTLRRGHPRIRPCTSAAVEAFVREAIRVFDTLAECPRIAARTVVIDDGELSCDSLAIKSAETAKVLSLIQLSLNSTPPLDLGVKPGFVRQAKVGSRSRSLHDVTN